MMFGENLGAAETAKRIPVGSVGVEIGVWRGDSTALFLEHAAHVHLVDPWSVTAYKDSGEFGDYAAYLKRYEPLVGSRNPREFQRYYDALHDCVKARFGDRVTIHRCASVRFFEYFKGPVDWVYVDGAHTFDACWSDLVAAKKILKPGGMIFGDDFGNKPDVTSAVSDFASGELPLEIFGGNQYQITV